jgi:hypothetical protein
MDFFLDRLCVIATMHEKEKTIAPILIQELGMKTIVPQDFNTDFFGTFTRDIDRPANQIDTAKLKAEKALEITGETIAIASEGSFTSHPLLPYLAADREIVLLWDASHNLLVYGEELSSDTNYQQQEIGSVEEGLSFAAKIGFPSHGTIVRTSADTKKPEEIIKGITQEEILIESIESMLQKTSNDKVFIETDMRALYNPTRLKVIALATKNLVEKLKNHCPSCGFPAFQVRERKKGLPCELCGLPTSLIRSVTYNCDRCGFRQEKLFPHGEELAEAMYCQYCNP